MKRFKHVFWEVALVLASVLIFRSLWNIMDSYIPLKEITVLWTSFFLGLVISGIAVYYLSHDGN